MQTKTNAKFALRLKRDLPMSIYKGHLNALRADICVSLKPMVVLKTENYCRLEPSKNNYSFNWKY